MRARDNPFRTERLLQIRYRLCDTTWPQLLARLERLRFRAALVGPHGSGKTTLLEDLQERLRERGFGTLCIRLDDEQRSFENGFLDRLFGGVTGNEIILFDGAEQMGPLVWWRFQRRSRRAGGLIITTHRPGRLPTLLECCTTAGLLAGIASELLGEDLERVQLQAEMLYQKYRGNLRDALREWYDHGAVAIQVNRHCVLHGAACSDRNSGPLVFCLHGSRIEINTNDATFLPASDNIQQAIMVQIRQSHAIGPSGRVVNRVPDPRFPASVTKRLET